MAKGGGNDLVRDLKKGKGIELAKYFKKSY